MYRNNTAQTIQHKQYSTNNTNTNHTKTDTSRVPVVCSTSIKTGPVFESHCGLFKNTAFWYGLPVFFSVISEWFVLVDLAVNDEILLLLGVVQLICYTVSASYICIELGFYFVDVSSATDESWLLSVLTHGIEL